MRPNPWTHAAAMATSHDIPAPRSGMPRRTAKRCVANRPSSRRAARADRPPFIRSMPPALSQPLPPGANLQRPGPPDRHHRRRRCPSLVRRQAHAGYIEGGGCEQSREPRCYEGRPCLARPGSYLVTPPEAGISADVVSRSLMARWVRP